MVEHSTTNTQVAASEFEEKVIKISRVSKKTKGGNKMGFSILMVVGDKKGRVGVGLGKAGDVLSAMRKGAKKAKKHLLTVPLDGTTIPFAVKVKLGAAWIMLKPAPKGSGVIAGGPVRAVVEAAGVRDISSKILGTTNQSSNVYATFEALRKIQALVAIKGISLKSIAETEAEEAKKMEELQAKAKKEKEAKDAEAEVAPKASPAKAKTPKVAKPKAEKAVATSETATKKAEKTVATEKKSKKEAAEAK